MQRVTKATLLAECRDYAKFLNKKLTELSAMTKDELLLMKEKIDNMSEEERVLNKIDAKPLKEIEVDNNSDKPISPVKTFNFNMSGGKFQRSAERGTKRSKKQLIEELARKKQIEQDLLNNSHENNVDDISVLNQTDNANEILESHEHVEENQQIVDSDEHSILDKL